MGGQNAREGGGGGGDGPEAIPPVSPTTEEVHGVSRGLQGMAVVLTEHGSDEEKDDWQSPPRIRRQRALLLPSSLLPPPHQLQQDEGTRERHTPRTDSTPLDQETTETLLTPLHLLGSLEPLRLPPFQPISTLQRIHHRTR